MGLISELLHPFLSDPREDQRLYLLRRLRYEIVLRDVKCRKQYCHCLCALRGQGYERRQPTTQWGSCVSQIKRGALRAPLNRVS
jgi:hypothetical protein